MEGKERKGNKGKETGGPGILEGVGVAKEVFSRFKIYLDFLKKAMMWFLAAYSFIEAEKKKFQRAQNSEQRFIWVAFCLVYGIVGGACAVYDGSRAYFWWVLSGWGPDSIELGWSVFFYLFLIFNKWDDVSAQFVPSGV